MAGITRDPQLGALLVAFFFALFFEGAAGFGTPVALAAPLLVGLGFPPVQALTLTLIGHSIGVSFGAVGTPVNVQSGAWSQLELSGAIALLHAALGWTMAMWVYRIAGQPSTEAGTLRRWLWPLLAAACFLLPYFVIASWVGPELPTLGGALLGGCVFAFCVRGRATELMPICQLRLNRNAAACLIAFREGVRSSSAKLPSQLAVATSIGYG